MRDDEQKVWALSTADEVQVDTRPGSTGLPGTAATSADRITGQLVEQEDGTLVLFYGPI